MALSLFWGEDADRNLVLTDQKDDAIHDIVFYRNTYYTSLRGPDVGLLFTEDKKGNIYVDDDDKQLKVMNHKDYLRD